jgi:hypothetical protein
LNDKTGIIDIRQSAQVSQMQEELLFLRGQNEALFKMLSFLTEKSGGDLVIPKDFGEKVIGSNFNFDRNDAGDYVMNVTREAIIEDAATSK